MFYFIQVNSKDRSRYYFCGDKQFEAEERFRRFKIIFDTSDIFLVLQTANEIKYLEIYEAKHYGNWKIFCL